MTEREPHVPAETQAALAARLERQRESLPWLDVAESVVAPSATWALLGRLAEPRRATPSA